MELDPTASAEDIVVYIVKDGGTLMSWGRGTLADAIKFVAHPKYPAHEDDRFIAFDDWGHGNVVAAYDEKLVGLSKSKAVEKLT